MRALLPATLITVALAAFLTWAHGATPWEMLDPRPHAARTVSDVIERYGEAADARISSHFKAVGVAYPPQRIALVATKSEELLAVWASNGGPLVHVHDYQIRAASGVLGPKLREGDRQVPEGIYELVAFNPNSSYHLSMKVNYPNAFDKKWAVAEGRTQPGGDIFIHGRAVSIGCLAMGDRAIEELFTLVYRVGRGKTQVVITPTDPRKGKLQPPSDSAAWVTTLYGDIETTLQGIYPTWRE